MVPESGLKKSGRWFMTICNIFDKVRMLSKIYISLHKNVQIIVQKKVNKFCNFFAIAHFLCILVYT